MVKRYYNINDIDRLLCFTICALIDTFFVKFEKMSEDNKRVVINRISIPIDEKECISALVSLPDTFHPGQGTGVILAHGAGNDMESSLLGGLALGLARAGHLVLRFNFPYKEKGKKVPDSQIKLERTWHSVWTFFQEYPGFAPLRIVAAGKSMGGRIASQMAAAGKLPVDRLIFYGYPLHPPGKKEKLRDAHLYPIQVPMLFFAGTRDSLCDLDLLQDVLKKLKAAYSLEVISGGDHSFRVLKSSGLSPEAVLRLLVSKTVRWLAGDI